jgi:hypothetical protein
MLVEDNTFEAVGKGLVVGDTLEDRTLHAVGHSRAEAIVHQHSTTSQKAAAQVRKDRRKGAEHYSRSNARYQRAWRSGGPEPLARNRTWSWRRNEWKKGRL